MGLVFGSARTPRVFADSYRFPAPYIYNAELKRLLLFYNFMGIHFKISQVVVFYLFYIFVVLLNSLRGQGGTLGSDHGK